MNTLNISLALTFTVVLSFAVIVQVVRCDLKISRCWLCRITNRWRTRCNKRQGD